MIEGKVITLGGREFVAPPAPFITCRQHQDVFDGKKAPSIYDMADIVFAALKRNYPDLTQDDFETNCLDYGNLQIAFRAVMFIGGVKEQVPGEVDPGSQ
jgi:hypothetical protein